MKRKKIYLFILVLWLTGCNDFLEQSSQDEVRPSMVTDLEQILIGDGYQTKKHNFYYLTEMMTDNVKSVKPLSGQQDEFEQERWRFLWDPKMFDDDGGGYCADVWEMPYAAILGCNLVLDYLDEMKGEEKLRENIRGEALTLRAWNYFHLVNLFGIAYNQGNPETDLGVPLKLDATVTGEFFVRNTVKEVYAQVEKDLLEGNRLLTTYKFERSFFRINHVAAKTMLSRMYLYMEEWDKALAYADSALAVKSDLLDLNKGKQPYDKIESNEIIWVRECTEGWVWRYPALKEAFPLSNELVGLYEGSDLRTSYFLFLDRLMDRGTYSGVYKATNDYGNNQGIRTSELYLNRAEVYARKYLKEGDDEYRIKSLADLNELRKYRMKNDNYVETVITDGQELLEFCLKERRRELCGETCHRWGDVRRLGLTVAHKLYDSDVEFTRDMKHYVLPIPKRIREQNPALVQN